MDFGGLGIYKKTRNIFGKKIDPSENWIEEGKNYKVGRMNEITLSYLSKLDFKSVLDFGCGDGLAISEILKRFNCNYCSAFDISPHQIERAKIKHVEINVDFQVSSILDFTSDKKYDLVIGYGVLSYVSSSTIKESIQHLTKFCNKYFINVDPGYNSPLWGKNHIPGKTDRRIRHDFSKIYNELGMKSEEIPEQYACSLNAIFL